MILLGDPVMESAIRELQAQAATRYLVLDQADPAICCPDCTEVHYSIRVQGPYVLAEAVREADSIKTCHNRVFVVRGWEVMR